MQAGRTAGSPGAHHHPPQVPPELALALTLEHKSEAASEEATYTTTLLQ